MSAHRHLALIVCYGVLSGAVAFYLPQWQPEIGQSIALVSGALIFLGCALLHETYGRIGRESDFGQQLYDVRFDQIEMRDDLGWTQREVKLMRQALEAVLDAGGGSRAIDEVMAEVKVLQSLAGRLSRDDNSAVFRGREEDPSRAHRDDRTAIDVEAVSNPTVASEELDDATILDVVREALRDDRVEVVLQPIVSLPQRKRRYYECYSRLSSADGTVVVPEQYLEIAHREGLITAIDNMLLFRCIQLVRRIQRSSQDVGFFCNVSQHTLGDEGFFGDFVEYLESNRDLGPGLVFEFAQEAFMEAAPGAARMLERLASLGCRISIDHVSDLDVDVNALARLNVSFLKVEGEMLLSGDTANRAALLDLKRRLDKARIDLIAEKIEREEDLIELLDYSIDFGQGFLLGEPRIAK